MEANEAQLTRPGWMVGNLSLMLSSCHGLTSISDAGESWLVLERAGSVRDLRWFLT